LVGWTGPTTFIAYSWRPDCGYEDLRTFGIVTKQETVWYSGAFDAAAWSPTGQSLLIVVGDYHGFSVCQVIDPGLYLSTPAKPTPRMIGPVSSSDSYQVQWSPAAKQFFLEEDGNGGVSVGVFSIKPDGTKAGNWPMPTMPSVSPDAKNMAWIEDGVLNISDVQNFSAVNVAENVQSVAWVP
jgi:hypothetical protein